MTIADVVTEERVRLAADVRSKKRALEQLAEVLDQGTPYLTASEILAALVARERLGSTGIGMGVAIPHARMKGADESVGAFIRLPKAIDFNVNDQRPVDLVFGLLVPAESGEADLNLLRRITEMFSDTDTLADLRDACDDAALYRALLAHDPVN